MNSKLNLLPLDVDINQLKLPQNAIVCCSKIQSIGELIRSNNVHRFQDDKKLISLINIISKLFERIIKTNFEITSSLVLDRISNQLDVLEEQVKEFLMSSAVGWTERDDVLDKILEELPLLQLPVQDNLTTEKIKNLISDVISSNVQDLNAIKSAAKNSLDEINNYKIKTQSLAQLLANKTLNDSYDLRAKAEKRSAFWWTFATWIFAVLTVSALIYVFFIQIDAAANNAINYALLSTKILITASLGLIAKWASKRANRHLDEESKYHRLSVNMATINSFIAPLSEEEKYKVISAVAIKIFTEGTNNEVSTEFETASLLDIVKGLIPKTDK